eukprot:CAMPEP_0172472292 /NCGR_PEP_ID=MMETSP1065-20121228/68262_1 /TAXON_ID=265537 /ORGANISM="Amphiprora paludosa, Strain CCMP125" /LENGTH=220 /DNA_ID=CAMNT_0013230423 /DNA_START=158 /DNA_END=820 /DNA_ORIENTATION=+
MKAPTLLLVSLWLIPSGVAAFVPEPFATTRRNHPSRPMTIPVLLAAAEPEPNQEPLFPSRSGTSSSSSLPPNFNPLAPVSSSNSNSNSNSPATTTTARASTVISLRQLQKQEMMQQLLSAISESPPPSHQVQDILEQYHDLLMAPFVDPDFCDDDPDTIYTPDMKTPQEKWHAYQDTMSQRIAQARNESVQRLLQAMLDYVETALEEITEEEGEVNSEGS